MFEHLTSSEIEDGRSSSDGFQHTGVLGNKAADRVATEAASHSPHAQTDPEPQLEPGSLWTLMATTESAIGQTMRDTWERSRAVAKHGRELFSLGVWPGKGKLTTHISTHQAISSVITQMRTGKISLRAYLHPIGKADTDEGQYGYGRSRLWLLVVFLNLAVTTQLSGGLVGTVRDFICLRQLVDLPHDGLRSST